MPITGSFFLEFSTHFDQVAGEGDNVLWLLYHVEIDHAHLGAASTLALDPFQLSPFECDQLFRELGRLVYQSIHVSVIVRTDPVGTAGNDVRALGGPL